ncbi:CYTH domain-containing protein [Paraburkholderia aspalathi]|nr:CYTH domain-containing protein [Paraburkholderia aspalathi]MBK3780155.1 CYTH domain-containing protein [Paraburkholderia aspalathi]
MAKEIERKFLVRNDSWRAGVSRIARIHQGYLSLDPARTVRVRTRDNDRAWFGAKGMTEDIERPEFEYPIPVADARQMFAMCLASVEKLRHDIVYVDGHSWELDVFQGLNAPLILAEIELATRGEEFERPAWLGAEVSHDPAYFNSALAVRPYSLW